MTDNFFRGVPLYMCNFIISLFRFANVDLPVMFVFACLTYRQGLWRDNAIGRVQSELPNNDSWFYPLLSIGKFIKPVFNVACFKLLHLFWRNRLESQKSIGTKNARNSAGQCRIVQEMNCFFCC